jgi:thioredoxin
MNPDEFMGKLRSNSSPVVVDFWAPWCAPCRVIGPVVERSGEEYAGRVDLWKVNTDEQPELLQALHVHGIPTLIAFTNGEETGRLTGTASATTISSLFAAALTGKQEDIKRLGPGERILRLGIGLALVVFASLAGLAGIYLLVAGLGVVIMFMAVYDRCPIYRAVSARLKELFQKRTA